jgi:hypothetical protein
VQKEQRELMPKLQSSAHMKKDMMEVRGEKGKEKIARRVIE